MEPVNNPTVGEAGVSKSNDILVKFKHKDIMSFEFNQIMSKVANTPTKPQIAGQIRKVIQAVQVVRDTISGSYQEKVLGQYFQKNEDGTLKKVEGQDEYIPLEGKEKEIEKANADFGEIEVEVVLSNVRPLSPASLADVKVSARELELLKGLFVDQDGPGIPGTLPFPVADGFQPRIQ